MKSYILNIRKKKVQQQTQAAAAAVQTALHSKDKIVLRSNNLVQSFECARQ